MGVSVNKLEASRSFAEKLGLTFPLLCDTRKKVCRRYGVLGFWRLAKRTTFVIDAEGTVRQIDRGSDAMDPARALQACTQQMPRID